MADRKIAAFVQNEIYPPNLEKNALAIATAGWTILIVSLFHVDESGNIFFNSTQILADGKYIGDSNWPAQLWRLKVGPGSKIETLLASIGGGGVSDFTSIQSIYENNSYSFENTVLQENFQTFHDKFPAIRTIDMDAEDAYDPPSFVAFCRMLIEIGFDITFCPFEDEKFWTGCLATLHASNPGAVKWWNLQCYDGGRGNEPKDWADKITKAIPKFDTKGFFLVSDWSRLLAKWPNRPWEWLGDCPPAMEKLMTTFAKEPSVSGAFIWTIDYILSYAADQKKKPDDHSCGVVGMTDYIAAIKNGLG